VDVKVLDSLACGLADTHQQISTPRSKKVRYSTRLSYFRFGCTYRYCRQARCQDLAAGGQKPEGGAKHQKGGHIFKIQYWMYAATGRPNVKWRGTNFKWGAAPLAPRWRRPWLQTTPKEVGNLLGGVMSLSNGESR